MPTGRSMILPRPAAALICLACCAAMGCQNSRWGGTSWVATAESQRAATQEIFSDAFVSARAFAYQQRNPDLPDEEARERAKRDLEQQGQARAADQSEAPAHLAVLVFRRDGSFASGYAEAPVAEGSGPVEIGRFTQIDGTWEPAGENRLRIHGQWQGPVIIEGQEPPDPQPFEAVLAEEDDGTLRIVSGFVPASIDKIRDRVFEPLNRPVKVIPIGTGRSAGDAATGSARTDGDL